MKKKYYKSTVSIILLILIFLPNTRVVYKYIEDFQLVILSLYLLVFLIILYLSLRIKNSKILGNFIASKKFILLVFSILTVLVVILYPIADELKLDMRGSDQDDCVILTTGQILNFEYPYSVSSYFGNPCSTGPGMIFLLFPFVLINLYQLGAVFYSLIAYLYLRKDLSDKSVGPIFLTTLFSSAFIIEMFVVGSDLLTIGFGIILMLYSLKNNPNYKSNRLFLSAILVGLISSTRINFMIIFPFIAFLIFTQNKLKGIYFALISFSVAIIPSIVLYLIDPINFTPIHLIGKATGLLSPLIITVTVFSTIASFIYSIIMTKNSLNKIHFAFLITIAPHLFALALADLVSRNYDFSIWEGANYFVPIIPILIWCLIDLLQYDKVSYHELKR